jgi:diguanylate cyclase (GGDEF)-like protein/PAS domain S-box-containing protein
VRKYNRGWSGALSRFMEWPGNLPRAHQLLILLMGWGFFLVGFILLHATFGDGVAVLCILPVMLSGWLFGPWAGLAAAVAAGGASVGLIYLSGTPLDTSLFITHGSIGAILLLALGLALGAAHDLRRRLQADLQRHQADARILDQSETRYRSLFESSSDGIFLLEGGRFIDCNAQVCRMWACRRPDVIGATPGDFSPEFQPNGRRSLEVVREIMLAAQGGQPQVFFWQHLRRDGQPIETEISIKAIDFSQRSLLLAQMRDLSERRAIERRELEQRALAEALRDITALLASALELDEVLEKILANVGRVVPHDGANIALLDANQVIERVARGGTGYKYRTSGPDTFVGVPMQEIPGLAEMARSAGPLLVSDTHAYPGWKVFEESAWVRSYLGVAIRAQGRTVGFINLDSATPNFFQPVHAQRILAFADLAAIAIHNARLYASVQQQAVTDELTGLYNRRGLMAFGQHEVERSLRFKTPLSVLMFDVDNFKQVNDQAGYHAGDEVLYTLALRCRACLRAVDVAGRYGGDEFVFVLPDTPLAGALQAGERLRAAVGDTPFSTSAGEMKIAISVGAAFLQPPLLNFDQLIVQAGAAVHAAKFGGKNRVAG